MSPPRYHASLRRALYDAALAAVPPLAWDAGVTKSGSHRGRNDLGWYLTTSYEHSGWLHVTTHGGFRATREGAAALAEYPSPEALFDASGEGYLVWNTARTEPPTPVLGDPSDEILHGTIGAPRRRILERLGGQGGRVAISASPTTKTPGAARFPSRGFTTRLLRHDGAPRVAPPEPARPGPNPARRRAKLSRGHQGVVARLSSGPPSRASVRPNGSGTGQYHP